MKPLHWVSSTRKNVRQFPETVREEVGFALYLAQMGEKGINAVPMLGFGGASVLEVVIDADGNTFRAVYTVKFAKAIYVLHAFQKKSKRGIATPRPDSELIRSRLTLARKHYADTYEHSERKARRHE